MRWLWIDRFIEFEPRTRAVSIKSISLAEEHLHDHFAARGDRPAMPVMPASLIVEGVAQTAGILVGHASEFREKTILAKVSDASFEREATPGSTLRYTVAIQNFDVSGAAIAAQVHMLDHADHSLGYQTFGKVDLMFSHLDRNMAGTVFPEHNFVFGDSFRTLLRLSGIAFEG